MLRVAVIGATGAVGREMLRELEHFGIECTVGLFASARSAGSELKFHEQEVAVEEFSREKLVDYGYILMSAGGVFSKEHTRALAAAGSVVIDNSSAWRMEDDVPLVVPEVNASVLKHNKSGIVANPNCSTIQLVVSLNPLQENFGLEAVNVSTYQSVSGSGQAGIEELTRQTNQWVNKENLTADKYHRPIFNNVIPAIDVMRAGGHCFEEEKMIRETKKIMSLPELHMLATTVRVPVLKCHSEAVTVILGRDVARSEVFASFKGRPGLQLSADDSYESFGYPSEMVYQRDVLVSRVRLPFGHEASRTVQYWNVADNLKKGAATNAVQILARLLEG